jgi:hypothetical protein
MFHNEEYRVDVGDRETGIRIPVILLKWTDLKPEVFSCSQKLFSRTQNVAK